jgi:hypothetical protein
LVHAELAALTRATLTDRDQLREALLKIREQGWGWVDGELDESICGLAVPVRDRSGATIAALNVSLPRGQFTQEKALSYKRCFSQVGELQSTSTETACRYELLEELAIKRAHVLQLAVGSSHPKEPCRKHDAEGGVT